MKTKHKKIIILALAAIFVFNSNICAKADPSLGRFIKEYSPVVKEALEAYNDEKYQEFYKNFSNTKKDKTKKMFQFKWVDLNKKRYGKLIEEKIQKEECIMKDPYPALVYRAVFEKNKTTKIKATFIQENKEYKLFALTFEDV